MSRADDRHAGRCELCARQGVELTRHHLIPRTLHRNKQTRRQFARADMHGRVLQVCRACHKQIHALFSEKELAAHYHSRDALLGHPDMARFVRWVARRPAGFTPATRRSQRRR